MIYVIYVISVQGIASDVQLYGEACLLHGSEPVELYHPVSKPPLPGIKVLQNTAQRFSKYDSNAAIHAKLSCFELVYSHGEIVLQMYTGVQNSWKCGILVSR